MGSSAGGPLKIVPSDIFPALRRFLVEGGLKKTRKAFGSETLSDVQVPAKPKKKAKALEDLDLTAACQLRHRKIVSSDIYPALRRFLLEGGLQNTLKALNSETA